MNSRKARYDLGFQLIATANPCKCGYYQSSLKDCFCKEYEIHNYFRKISGGLLDRLTLFKYVSGEDKRKSYNFEQLADMIANYYIKTKSLEFPKEHKPIIKNILETFTLSERKRQKLPKLTKIIAKLEKSKAISKDHYYKAALLCDDSQFRKIISQ